MPPGIAKAQESMALGMHGDSSCGAESFAVCCSSLNHSLGEAVQTAELFFFRYLCGSVSGTLGFCVTSYTFFIGIGEYCYT